MSNGRLCDQDFEELRATALESGELFEDPEFPPDDQSLFFSKDPPYAFEWKRASEICDNPRLFEGGASRFDINQVTNNSFGRKWKKCIEYPIKLTNTVHICIGRAWRLLATCGISKSSDE